jgi:hypothetical protein
MKISYGLTVCNEHEELQNLIEYLVKRIDGEDEIVVVYDQNRVTPEVLKVIEDYKEEAYITGISTLGDYRIALPSDFGHLIGSLTVVDDDDTTNTLIKISKQEYDELYPYRLATAVANRITGYPKHFCIYGEQIFIGPVPDAITYRYQMNYTTEAYTEVTSVTDPVPFTDEYRNILRAGVLYELYNGLEQYEEANYWEQKYLEGVAKMKNNDENNIGNTSSTIAYSGV